MVRKSIRTLRRGALGAAALMLLAPSVVARPDAYGDRFDIYFGGIRAGQLDIAMHFQDGKYTATSELRSAGVVGFFYDAFYQAEAEGREATASRLHPTVFAAKSKFDGDKQDVTIRFGPSGPRKVEAEPAYKPKPYEIDPTAQHGAIDPLSAAVALLTPARPDEICDSKVTVFDGRHRIDITLDKPEALPEQKQIRCQATFTRVAGFKPKAMRKQTDFPFRVYFDKGEDGLARLRQIVVDTDYGVAVATRAD